MSALKSDRAIHAGIIAHHFDALMLEQSDEFLAGYLMAASGASDDECRAAVAERRASL
jgi:hypothetical protein